MKACEYPDVMKFWDYEANKKKPEDVEDTFTGVICFKCEKGHTWKKPFARYVKQKTHECYQCQQETTKASKNENVIKFFDQELNIGVNLDDYSIYDNKLQVNWKCPDCGKMFSSTIVSRKDRSDCPYCNGHYRQTTYDKEFPRIAERWSNKNGKPLSEVKGSENKINFIFECPKHGEYEASINNLTKNYNSVALGCPYCYNQSTVVEDSFGYKHPEMVKDLSPKEDVDLYNVRELSKKEVLWICPECGEEYKDLIAHKALGLTHCPKELFWKEHPEFERYYSDKNPTKYKRLAMRSNQKLLWNCDNGHEILYSPDELIRKEKFDCPYCENRKLLSGFNDFSSIDLPYKTEFCDLENKLLDVNISELKINNRVDELFWKCPICGEKYQMTLAERHEYYLRDINPCRICKGLMVNKKHF